VAAAAAATCLCAPPRIGQASIIVAFRKPSFVITLENSMRRLLSALVATFALVSVRPAPVSAQLFDRLTNPKVTVAIHHAPGLGLQVQQVAFGEPQGWRSRELLNALTNDFVNSGVRVMDVQHFQDALAEHQVYYRGSIDREMAQRMGRYVDGTALVLISVVRATTEKKQFTSESTDSKKVTHTQYHSTNQATFRVSVQTIDLKSGQIFQAHTFENSPKLENVAPEKCCAPYPTDLQVLELAQQAAVNDIHRMFVAWTEPKEMYFFNDKDCQLDVAYKYLKAGTLEDADRQSVENLERCRASQPADDKHLAHGFYNAGMMAFLLGNYDRASEQFALAEHTKHIDITTDAIAELGRARSSEAELRQVQANAAIVASSIDSARANRPAPAPSATPGTPAAKGTPAERLKALNDLYTQGLVTKEEYEKKRADILRDM
jgi:Curli production assembly/transport component CsgG